MQINVLLPTLNEEGNVGPIIEEILKIDDVLITVIDDDSLDQTAEIVKRIQEKHPNVKLIERIGERGLTSAIQRGIDESEADIICWMDVDFSHPPEVLPDLIQPILDNRYDAVVASRYLLGSQDQTTNDGNWVIKFQKKLSFLLSFYCSRLLNIPEVSDWTSGFIAVRARTLKSHTLVGDYGEYFIALMCELKRDNARIKSVPYISPPRRSGYSKTAVTYTDLVRRGYKYVLVLWHQMQMRRR